MQFLSSIAGISHRHHNQKLHPSLSIATDSPMKLVKHPKQIVSLCWRCLSFDDTDSATLTSTLNNTVSNPAIVYTMQFSQGKKWKGYYEMLHLAAKIYKTVVVALFICSPLITAQKKHDRWKVNGATSQSVVVTAT